MQAKEVYDPIKEMLHYTKKNLKVKDCSSVVNHAVSPFFHYVIEFGIWNVNKQKVEYVNFNQTCDSCAMCGFKDSKEQFKVIYLDFFLNLT